MAASLSTAKNEALIQDLTLDEVYRLLADDDAKEIFDEVESEESAPERLRSAIQLSRDTSPGAPSELAIEAHKTVLVERVRTFFEDHRFPAPLAADLLPAVKTGAPLEWALDSLSNVVIPEESQ